MLENKNYWKVENKGNKVGELMIYGVIDDVMSCGDEVTPETIDTEIKALGELDILNVYINSPGGSVFAAVAIGNIISRCGAKIKNGYNDGLVASAATIPYLLCDKNYSASNSLFMIHLPQVICKGNSNEIRKMADRLDMVMDSIVSVYSKKTKMPSDKLIQLMSDETWLTAQQCLDMGFIDEIKSDLKISACLDGDFLIVNKEKFQLKDFNKIPPVELISNENREVIPEPVSNKVMKEDINENCKIINEHLLEQRKEFERIKNKIMGGLNHD